jgi:tetratricopeptide (TPR) repeat protein
MLNPLGSEAILCRAFYAEVIWPREVAIPRGQPLRLNDALRQAGDNEKLKTLHPAFFGWSAENFFHATDFKSTIEVCHALVKRFPSSEWAGNARLLEAQAHLHLGDVDAALHAYDEAASGSSPIAADARFAHAQLLERNGRKDEAVASYGELVQAPAVESRHSWFERIEQAAERCIRRCTHPNPPPTCTSPRDLAFRLAKALRERDFHELRRLASPTHFGWGGPEVGAQGFDSIADALKSDLHCSEVLADPMRLEGNGESVALVTTGWNGSVFIGRILFQLSNEPAGWQWTGVSLTGIGLLRKVGDDCPSFPRPSPGGYLQPDFSFKAPWAKDECLRAGGLYRFGESMTPLLGWLIILQDLFSDCGYGAYGAYYGGPIETHQGVNYFAVDFTGYWRPFAFASKIPVTTALAAHDGLVRRAVYTHPYADKSGANLVELDHLWPPELEHYLATGELPRGKIVAGGAFRTRYVHLGPGLYVSENMFIPQGTALGFMDDTGRSAFPHLHFSLHARDYVFADTPYYSVPLRNFDGRNLDGANDGDCVCSTNAGPAPVGPVL